MAWVKQPGGPPPMRFLSAVATNPGAEGHDRVRAGAWFELRLRLRHPRRPRGLPAPRHEGHVHDAVRHRLSRPPVRSAGLPGWSRHGSGRPAEGPFDIALPGPRHCRLPGSVIRVAGPRTRQSARISRCPALHSPPTPSSAPGGRLAFPAIRAKARPRCRAWPGSVHPTAPRS